MTFLYPLGLLGLIGVPVLILIYIIKNKYTEITVSSTYLWTLSEKFLKRRNPLSKLAGIISLILQILAIILVSLALAHPVLVLPNEANEYCFVLDASGSMNMETDGKTRFEAGKEKIASIIEDSVNGSTYTLVYVGDTTGVIFEKLDNRDQATLLLSEVDPVHGTAPMTDAIGVAQGYFNDNPAVKTYLVTDKVYTDAKHIEIINVSNKEENYSVFDLSYTVGVGGLTVRGNVLSYESDATLTVDLYLNDGKDPVASQIVAAKKLEVAPVEFSYNVQKFYSAKMVIRERDALSLDSTAVLYNVESENTYKALIVSERPFLLHAVLNAVGNTDIAVIKPDQYHAGINGYSLYIFDSFNPGSMPTDGSVWLVNLEGSLPEAGFSVQGEEEFEQGELLELTDSSASIVRRLTEGLTGENAYIKSYLRCSLYRNFTILYSYKGSPVIFTGTNTYGNREVVFAFDLHESDFALCMDYITLVKNLLDYSFPAVIEDVQYVCGEEAVVNVISGCESIRVVSPSGQISYLETGDAVSQFVLYEVGVYKITVTVSGTPREFFVYSEMQEEERAPSVLADAIALQGEADPIGHDGIYDNLLWLFIGLAVIFLADWMVYCYDKYQLR